MKDFLEDTTTSPKKVNIHDPRRASETGFHYAKPTVRASYNTVGKNTASSTGNSGYSGRSSSTGQSGYAGRSSYGSQTRTYTPGSYNGQSSLVAHSSSGVKNAPTTRAYSTQGNFSTRRSYAGNTGGNSNGRPSGGRSYGGTRSGSRTGGGYGGRSFGSNSGGRFGGRGGRGGNRFQGEYINEEKFIQKAILMEDVKPYIHTFTFPELEVNSALKGNILKKGYNIPTPIQDQTIPLIMSGKDVVGVANTGTGKTAAFLIPIIEKIFKDKSQKALIIVPTRELAEQINEELYMLTKNLRMFSVRCIGGTGIGGQIRNIRVGFNFIIGTPGRLKDLMDRRVLNIGLFQTIVLDEVDRMLDMGFVDEIKHILSLLPAEKQSLFFSATVDKKVDALIKTIIKPDFHKISVVQGTTSQNVNQDIVYYNDFVDKIDKLKLLIADKASDKVLVFANTKREVDKLDRMLYAHKVSVDSIHGDKRQNMRKRAIDNFKAGHTNVLIATDVAARGLDIPKVALVINYDIPNNFQDYIHRIGRTGRAQEIGDALTFVKKH